MCDGYAPFAAAFVTDEFDTTGYEIVRSAIEKAPKRPQNAQTDEKGTRICPKGLLARIRALRRR